MRKQILLVGLLFLSLIGWANACIDCTDSDINVSLSASFGSTHYKNVYAQDGQSALGRLSLTWDYTLVDWLHMGLDVGLQSGNTMRLAIEKPLLDELGGVPVSVIIKPMVDGLFSFTVTPFDAFNGFGFIKGGFIYRHLQVDRYEINDLSEIAPEMQFGMGFKFTEKSALFMGYQSIISRDVNYEVHTLTQTAHIAHIPSQNTWFLGGSLWF